MPRVFSHLHYRIVDVSTVKELYARWKPITLSSAPRKMGTHRSVFSQLELCFSSVLLLSEYFVEKSFFS